MENSSFSVGKLVSIALATIALAMVLGCDSSPELLNKSEEDTLNKIRSGKYTLINNQDLATLKHDADIGKNLGRYQIHNEGFRTWRLDTATGQICLLLASEYDWKKPETEMQSCNLSQPTN